MTLSATRAKALKDPGRYSDGGGLHLYISKAGGKSWVQRITIEGRRRDIGLGGFPSVSLARAREKAAENRAAVAEGRDPLADRHAPAMPTFREAAGAVHEANRPRWRNAKHIASWMQTLERHAMPTLGATPLGRIDRGEVLRVLIPIWRSRPETARRVRQHALDRFAQRIGATPLYCFYNNVDHRTAASHWHCRQQPQPDVPQMGCTLASLDAVRMIHNSPGPRTFSSVHSAPDAVPWRCLFHPACTTFGIHIVPPQYSEAINRGSSTFDYLSELISVDDDSIDIDDIIRQLDLEDFVERNATDGFVPIPERILSIRLED